MFAGKKLGRGGREAVIEMIVDNADVVEMQKTYGATFTDMQLKDIDEMFDNSSDFQDYLEQFDYSHDGEVTGGKTKGAINKARSVFKIIKGAYDRTLDFTEAFANHREHQRRLSVALAAKRKMENYVNKTGREDFKLSEAMYVGAAHTGAVDSVKSISEKSIIYANSVLGDYNKVPNWIKRTNILAPFMSFKYTTAKNFIRMHTNYIKSVMNAWTTKGLSLGRKIGITARDTSRTLLADVITLGLPTFVWNLSMYLMGAFNPDDQDYKNAQKYNWGLADLFGLDFEVGGSEGYGIKMFDTVGWMPSIPGLTSSATSHWGGSAWDTSANMVGETIASVYNPSSDKAWWESTSTNFLSSMNPLVKLPVELAMRSDIMGDSFVPWGDDKSVGTKAFRLFSDVLGVTKPYDMIRTGIERSQLEDASGYDNNLLARSIVYSRGQELGYIDPSASSYTTRGSATTRLRNDIKMAARTGSSQGLIEKSAAYIEHLRDMGTSDQDIRTLLRSAYSGAMPLNNIRQEDRSAFYDRLTTRQRAIVDRAIVDSHNTFERAGIGGHCLMVKKDERVNVDGTVANIEFPIELFPWQKNVFRSLFLSDDILVGGARGPGKSMLLAVMLVYYGYGVTQQ